MCCSAKVRNKFKQADIFGRPVRLTFKGQDTFKTAIGGLLTVLMVILSILYFSFGMLSLYQQQEALISR